MNNKREFPDIPDIPDKGQAVGGVLGPILARFRVAAAPTPKPAQTGSAPATAAWDAARAAQVQAAILARLDQAVAGIPANHPRRRSRLSILAGDRRIVAGLVAAKDAVLWDWLASLEDLLARWREWDRAKGT